MSYPIYHPTASHKATVRRSLSHFQIHTPSSSGPRRIWLALSALLKSIHWTHARKGTRRSSRLFHRTVYSHIITIPICLGEFGKEVGVVACGELAGAAQQTLHWHTSPASPPLHMTETTIILTGLKCRDDAPDVRYACNEECFCLTAVAPIFAKSVT